MRIKNVSFSSVVLGLACVAAFVSGCKNDDETPAQPPAGNDAGSPEQAKPFISPTDTSPVGKYTIGVLATELKNQPHEGVPDKIFPQIQVQANPNMAPPFNASQPGKLPLPGFGCGAFVIGKTASAPPPDLGMIGIQGLTSSQDVAPQMGCARIEVFPGTVLYACQLAPFPMPQPGPPNIALNAPVGKFFNKGDKMTVVTTGGADVGPIPPTDVQSSTIDDIKVTTDLWGITGAMVDGSQDLTINYTCNGGSCENADAVSIMMMVTDGQGGPPPTDPTLAPYSFYPFEKVFNVITCMEPGNLAPNSFTLTKEFLGKIFGGVGWHQIYTQISFPIQRIGSTAEGNAFVISTGYGVFGISKN
jgi:hypothetical protein